MMLGGVTIGRTLRTQNDDRINTGGGDGGDLYRFGMGYTHPVGHSSQMVIFQWNSVRATWFGRHVFEQLWCRRVWLWHVRKVCALRPVYKKVAGKNQYDNAKKLKCVDGGYGANKFVYHARLNYKVCAQALNYRLLSPGLVLSSLGTLWWKW